MLDAILLLLGVALVVNMNKRKEDELAALKKRLQGMSEAQLYAFAKCKGLHSKRDRSMAYELANEKKYHRLMK